jgi:hypothetical protein
MGIVLERRMHSKEEINDGKRFVATIAGGKTFLATTAVVEIERWIVVQQILKVSFCSRCCLRERDLVSSSVRRLWKQMVVVEEDTSAISSEEAEMQRTQLLLLQRQDDP